MSTTHRPAAASSAASPLPRPAGETVPVRAPAAAIGVRTGIPAARVLAQYHSANLAAALLTKPARLDPVWLPPVAHPQLIVQLSGVGCLDLTRQGQRQRYWTRTGSVFLNTPQQAPCDLAWQQQAAQGVLSVAINVAPTLLKQTAGAAGLDPDQLELLAGTDLAAPLLHQLGVSLAAALQAPEPADGLYVDTVAQMLATELVHRHSVRPAPRPAGRPGLSPARYRQLEEYVRASLGQVITLEQLAGIACLSTYHFCRVFRQATGQSPHQYVTTQRLTHARHLLLHSPLSVAQVARAVGYQSASHFARLFQRHTGGLPTDLRA